MIDWNGKFIVDNDVIIIHIIAPIKKDIELVIKYIFVLRELSNLWKYDSNIPGNIVTDTGNHEHFNPYTGFIVGNCIYSGLLKSFNKKSSYDVFSNTSIKTTNVISIDI